VDEVLLEIEPARVRADLGPDRPVADVTRELLAAVGELVGVVPSSMFVGTIALPRMTAAAAPDPLVALSAIGEALSARP